MTETFATCINKDSFCIINSQSKNTLLTLKVNEWETKFFKKKIGKLTIESDALNDLTPKKVNHFLDSLFSFADENNYEIVELQLNIQALHFVPVFEDRGFRLVDTKITFITLIEKEKIKKYSSTMGEIGFATTSDLKDILDLTSQSFVHNPAFFSRYKNRTYFTQEESERFFSAWITNHIEDLDSWFAVVKNDNKVIGYFIYKYAGLNKGKKIYKGVLTAVEPEYRGYKLHILMQSFLYNQFSENQFYIDSTTQLTNFATIKSHTRSQKSLNRIELTFYRPKSK